MNKLIRIETGLFLFSLIAAGCASSKAAVSPERVAASEGAVRAAESSGADTPQSPSAQHHLKLAREEIRRAQDKMDEGEAKEAELLFIRARVDAELAQALAQADAAERDATKVKDQLSRMKATSPSPILREQSGSMEQPEDEEGTEMD